MDTHQIRKKKRRKEKRKKTPTINQKNRSSKTVDDEANGRRAVQGYGCKTRIENKDCEVRRGSKNRKTTGKLSYKKRGER
jgi:hypothetical protein